MQKIWGNKSPFFCYHILGGILRGKSLVPDSGSRFWFRMFQIPGLDSRYWFQILVPHTGSGYRFQIPVPDTGSRYWFQILVPDTGSGYWFRILVLDTGSGYWFWILVLHFEGQIKNNYDFSCIFQIVLFSLYCSSLT